jgi:hypothetical protein
VGSVMKSAFTIVAMCVILFSGTCLVARSADSFGIRPRPLCSDRTRTRTRLCAWETVSAGDGASVDQSYPAWLYRRLQADGYHYRVVNAGVSGIGWATGYDACRAMSFFHPRIAVVELGSNDPDARRGTSGRLSSPRSCTGYRCKAYRSCWVG